MCSPWVQGRPRQPPVRVWLATSSGPGFRSLLEVEPSPSPRPEQGGWGKAASPRALEGRAGSLDRILCPWVEGFLAPRKGTHRNSLPINIYLTLQCPCASSSSLSSDSAVLLLHAPPHPGQTTAALVSHLGSTSPDPRPLHLPCHTC